MDFLLCSDTGYFQHLLVTAYSILANHTENDINIHVFSNGINDGCKHRLEEVVSFFPQARVFFYEIENIEKRLGRTVNVELTINVYMRLFVTEFIPKSIKRILYLDCDVIVKKNLSGLFAINMNGCDIAAVQGTMDYTEGELPHINSGVVLFDLEKCREKDSLNRYISIIEEYNGKLRFHDQTVLFEAHKGHIMYLDLCYNVTTPIRYLSYRRICQFYGIKDYYTEEIYKKAKSDPAIVHMTSWVFGRPWQEKSHHPNQKEYIDILEKIGGGFTLSPVSCNSRWWVYLIAYKYCPMIILRIMRRIKSK